MFCFKLLFLVEAVAQLLGLTLGCKGGVKQVQCMVDQEEQSVIGQVVSNAPF